jgi:hypothetical protein
MPNPTRADRPSPGGGPMRVMKLAPSRPSRDRTVGGLGGPRRGWPVRLADVTPVTSSSAVIRAIDATVAPPNSSVEGSARHRVDARNHAPQGSQRANAHRCWNVIPQSRTSGKYEACASRDTKLDTSQGSYVVRARRTARRHGGGVMCERAPACLVPNRRLFVIKLVPFCRRP